MAASLDAKNSLDVLKDLGLGQRLAEPD